MWGAEDLSASLGATEKASGGVFHSPYRLARDLCLMAAAAAEVAPIDTVYTDIDNLTGLEQETRAARRDGFSAKALIHPKHVEIVNAAFEPTDAERKFSARPRSERRHHDRSPSRKRPGDHGILRANEEAGDACRDRRPFRLAAFLDLQPARDAVGEGLSL
jgi:hypothetical protein